MPRPSALARLALGLVACSGVPACHSAPAAETPASKPKPPRLLLSIVVDQLSAWEAAERLPLLPADGGFARLRREGLYVKELRYPYAVTDTAPGHAALYTGAVPRETGIFGNETLGPDGQPRSILLDDSTRLVDPHGAVMDRPGSSLARLRVETLADVLVAEVPGAKVYTFSLKDRGALFGGGRHPTAALWLDVASQSFVSSTSFAAPPFMVAGEGDRDAVEKARAADWRLRDEERAWVSTHAETPDDQPGEGDLAGLGRTFPHAVSSAKTMRATPRGDAMLFDLGRGALGYFRASDPNDRTPPVLITLSLSSHDYVNHVFGPQSWEAWAELLELDRQLAAFLQDADRAAGPNGYDVMLTGDHGGNALPEVAPDLEAADCAQPHHAASDRWERPCDRRRRIDPHDTVPKVEAAVTAALGPGPWIAGFVEPYVYLSPRGRALDPGGRARMVKAASEALAPLGVRAVVDARAERACASADSIESFVCRAIDPSGPGDLYLLVAPGVFFDPDLARGSGTSHGSPYLYDRSVPLIVRAPGRVPAGVTVDKPVAFTAFTRTAASLLGIRAPAGAGEGEDLTRR